MRFVIICDIPEITDPNGAQADEATTDLTTLTTMLQSEIRKTYPQTTVWLDEATIEE